MQFALKLIVNAFRINLGICHFTLYGLYMNMVRSRVLDLSFILTRTHQKIKALFWSINFDYKTKFSFEYKKRNIYLIIVIYFMNFMNFDFIFKFFLLERKKIYTRKIIVTLNFSLLCHICFQSFFPLLC